MEVAERELLEGAHVERDIEDATMDARGEVPFPDKDEIEVDEGALARGLFLNYTPKRRLATYS